MNHRGCTMTDMTWYNIMSGLDDAELVVLSGVGKSMDVATRGASLLISAGVPAIAIHATDLLHGPATVFKTRRVAVIFISHSGETDEVIRALRHLEGVTDQRICITSGCYSALARMSEHKMTYTMTLGTDSDSGPFNNLPTASAECQQRWVDAIANHFAVQNMHHLKFGHPAGEIGKRYDVVE